VRSQDSRHAAVARRSILAVGGSADPASGAAPGASLGKHRRRRPAGEPPPLPRDLHGFAPLWIGVVLLLALAYWWGRSSGVAGEFQRAVDRFGYRLVPDISSWWERGTGRLIAQGGGWAREVGWQMLLWAMALFLIAGKRWRHLAVFAGSVALVKVMVEWFPTAGVQGSGIPSHPSSAAAGVAMTLVTAVFGFAPPGRWRRLALAGSAALCVGLAALWIATRQFTSSEIATGFAIGFAIPFLGFRVFAPESVFPVTYRGGRTAHQVVQGRRLEAINTALREQLGIQPVAVEPFALTASGGSTPLRIRLAGGRNLFAKLYAVNHMRADRWYKLGRTVMYGALEDERSFNSVRRMVEYEDYMLRYLRDNGVPAAEPHGFAEITPEREYLLVTEFIEDANEMLLAPIDDAVMASAIDVVRALWDAGIAHRDIKPANVLVRGGRVYVIDAFFCQLRPSAWRQSVDLANMMLMLALRSDSTRVYEAALRRFTPEEVAEAFAATRGVTVPRQLRTMVMRDERSLAKEFAQLAPPRRRIPVQRWTLRRLALAGALVIGFCAAVAATVLNLESISFSP
jgi:tRNA A-37 threonylcarbamoyl transferase component Bud32